MAVSSDGGQKVNDWCYLHNDVTQPVLIEMIGCATTACTCDYIEPEPQEPTMADKIRKISRRQMRKYFKKVKK